MIDRMDLADTTHPKKLATALLGQIPDLTPPIPIDAIARECGICGIEALTTGGFEGGLVQTDDKQEGIILVNAQSPARRQRFTIGHELGHFLNPLHELPGNEFQCRQEDFRLADLQDANRSRQMEAEANLFAVEVLFPERLFRADLRKLCVPDLNHVIKLSERYDMSREATARRFVRLHDEPCAVVFSKDDRCLYFDKHDDFPYLPFRAGMELPKQTNRLSLALSDGESSSLDEVDAIEWFDRSLRPGAALYQQLLKQRNGYAITLLNVDESGVDDDGIDYQRQWTPSFH